MLPGLEKLQADGQAGGEPPECRAATSPVFAIKVSAGVPAVGAAMAGGPSPAASLPAPAQPQGAQHPGTAAVRAAGSDPARPAGPGAAAAHQQFQGRGPAGAAAAAAQPPPPKLRYSSVSQFGQLREVYNSRQSTVFRSVCLASGAQVILKRYSKRKMDDKAVSKMRREIRIMHRLRGQVGVTQILGEFENTKHAFIVMEWAEGGDLYKRSTSTRLEEHWVCAKVVTPLLHVLRVLHDTHGVAHRDIKPENLFLTARDELLVGDFGLAIQHRQELPFLRAGTLDYMSPEVLRNPLSDSLDEASDHTAEKLRRLGFEPYSQEVDVWAVGVLAYELMMGGSTPFYHESTRETERLIMKCDLIPVHFPRHQTLAPWADFVRTALVRDPAKRPTAAQLLQHRWVRQHTVMQQRMAAAAAALQRGGGDQGLPRSASTPACMSAGGAVSRPQPPPRTLGLAQPGSGGASGPVSVLELLPSVATTMTESMSSGGSASGGASGGGTMSGSSRSTSSMSLGGLGSALPDTGLGRLGPLLEAVAASPAASPLAAAALPAGAAGLALLASSPFDRATSPSPACCDDTDMADGSAAAAASQSTPPLAVPLEATAPHAPPPIAPMSAAANAGAPMPAVLPAELEELPPAPPQSIQAALDAEAAQVAAQFGGPRSTGGCTPKRPSRLSLNTATALAHLGLGGPSTPRNQPSARSASASAPAPALLSAANKAVRRGRFAAYLSAGSAALQRQKNAVLRGLKSTVLRGSGTSGQGEALGTSASPGDATTPSSGRPSWAGSAPVQRYSIASSRDSLTSARLSIASATFMADLQGGLFESP